MSPENPLAAAFRSSALAQLASIDAEWATGLVKIPDDQLDELERTIRKIESDAREVGYNDVALICHKLSDLVGVARFRHEAVTRGIETLGALAISFAIMLLRSREQSTPGLDLPNFAAEIDAAVAEAQRVARQAENEQHAEPAAPDPEVGDDGYDELAVAAVDLYLESLALPASATGRLQRRWESLVEALRDLEAVPMQRRLDRYRVVAQQAADRAGNQVDVRADLVQLVLPPDQAKLMDLVLVELVENAVEHGIERHRARTVVGKQPWGIVTIWARREGNEIVLEVQDDGRGIDVRELRRQFPETADDADLLDQVADTSFSTRPRSRAGGATGEGLGRVKQAVTAMSGTFRLRSTISAGTTCEIRLPASDAVVDVWVFSLNDALYAVPATYEVEVAEGFGEHPLDYCGVPVMPPRSGGVIHVKSPGGNVSVLQADDAPRRATLPHRCQTPASHPASILWEHRRPVVFIRRPTTSEN